MDINVGFFLVSFFFHVPGGGGGKKFSTLPVSLVSGTAKLSFQIQVPHSVFAKAGINQGCTQTCKAWRSLHTQPGSTARFGMLLMLGAREGAISLSLLWLLGSLHGAT